MKPGDKPEGHISLGGDFFTYADRFVTSFFIYLGRAAL